MNKKIILASILPQAGNAEADRFDFSVDPADVDERVLPGEQPEAYAIRVALDKARVAAKRAGQSIVIAADTIVVLDNLILGKPIDASDAERMLTMLSGRKHRVITGLVIMDAGTGQAAAKAEITSVWFRELSAGEIHSYVLSGEPLDKAGAYGIQEKGALLVRKIEGCYFNVVGLPLALLGEMLRESGVSLF